MRLKQILTLLSFLAILSASAGGYLYYSTLLNSALNEAERQAGRRVEIIQKNLSSYLSENIRTVRALAGMGPLRDALLEKSEKSIAAANRVLDHFKETLAVDVCYLMTPEGKTIASSNRFAKDSFVGKNFSFRPYFSDALSGTTGTYLALGTTSKKRGAYYSHPVYSEGESSPVGVAVIKSSIEQIEKELGPSSSELVFVTSPEGVIFISSRKAFLYHILWRLPPEEKRRIKAGRQFGTGPWEWTGLEMTETGRVLGPDGTLYLMNRAEIDLHPGWQVVLLRNLKEASRVVTSPLVRVTGPIVLTFCFLFGLLVLILYKNASREIIQRKDAEEALKQSEERYRTIYHNTPAMLHSIDTSGRLVSVSDNWLEVMGYERHEVIGRKMTDFLTPDSKKFAQERVFPEFFATGRIKDIPYRFVKKSKEEIDVLLSAIAERDNGRIVRSLAVLIDVTEQKKAQEELNRAKEELAMYSRNLELQVRERTREITRMMNQIRRLSGSIISNQEKERAAIARELHDELGQSLSVLRMEAVWILKNAGNPETRMAARAANLCRIIEKTIEDVRSLTRRIRPGILDTLGLVDALEWLASDFELRTGISCLFVHDAVPVLGDSLATCAYRITQEALTNVLRHAEATHVDITLHVENGELVLVIRDNGRGFLLKDDDEENQGLGLAGMRERANLAGGSFYVLTEPGKGTSIVFRAPVMPFGDQG